MTNRGPRSFHGEAVDPSWADDALCRGTHPTTFAVDEHSHPLDIDNARSICNSCDVRLSCLEHAIANREQGMMWGGLLDGERRKYQKGAARRRRIEASGQIDLFEAYG